ncbi:hypothetical protein G6F57_011013 [Rhizopus arrhizus]|nr:hypothetical protein G6F24_012287 [Rhizopus arrhizus]KAG0780912.1 hypothetical protein G6F21_011911 [Rhizopus arrhizus]KAG0805614.1 hypothetical protein G6F20_011767 [Rhizopus arrhizus]KAG0821142.1 hypothetical protein G6F19_012084 [Rhizopus arrhizus]KAG0822104.1 hypothetical protein G6F18_011912 [Rhizopus arrhizus]
MHLTASEVCLNDEQARTLFSDEPAQVPTSHEQIQQEPLNDIQDCFRIFKNEVKRVLQVNQTLKIEEHVQELLSLNSIFLLQPLQYSQLMRSVFTDSLLAKIHDEFQKKIEFPDMKFTSAEFMSIVETIMNLDSGITSVLSTMAGLLQIASKMPYEKQSVIAGLATLIQKLPKNSINDVTTISETELWNTYFDFLLSCVVANSEKLVLLRWLDKGISSSLPLRPDAVVSIVDRLKFNGTLGHSEVKIAEPTCNKSALCMDLARITCFSKEAMDLHLLESSISFQIHGFAITFFLARLDHDGLYVMYEIGHLEFPSSLAQLPVFTNLKNLNILLLVCHVFWKFCKKPDIPNIMQQRLRTSVKLTDLIDFVLPSIKIRDKN